MTLHYLLSFVLQDKLDAARNLKNKRNLSVGDSSCQGTILSCQPDRQIEDIYNCTIFDKGLEMTLVDIKQYKHLNDFPGASLIIIELDEVNCNYFG